jgi:hypothetical protein|tara:strand:+ start:3961 stop:4329 length:369 start_codon:yes stop_codon:yes gene_type:complete
LRLSNDPAYADWKKAMREEYADKDTQSELRKIVIEGPEEYFQKVKRQEMRLSDFVEESGTVMRKSGDSATQEEINAMNERVEKRMLTESPALIEHKLTYRGGTLEPDFTLHEKDKKRRKKEW